MFCLVYSLPATFGHSKAILCAYSLSICSKYSNLPGYKLRCNKYKYCRSQWPRGLRHEMSSPAQTLGLWIRIPFGARLLVRVCPV
jgi:hypothetical protein